jgi:hypothetical protein
MFMLIGKKDKIVDIIKFLNVEHYSDLIDNIIYLKNKYLYFIIDKNGEILIAKENDEIKFNNYLIEKYHLNKLNFKRKFIIDIRKRKLKTLK